MLKFIIFDENPTIGEKVRSIINKKMMPSEAEYRIVLFERYTKEFKETIEEVERKKIYIFAIETADCSGLDIARKIRETDYESPIIILTSHYELAHIVFKSRLLILDFISKFDNYEKKLKEAIGLAVKVLGLKKNIILTYRKSIVNVDLSDVLYIINDSTKRTLIVKTYSGEYRVKKTISSINKELSDDFIQTHRNCIVNINNIDKIDFKEEKVIFKNREAVELISKKYMKDLKCRFKW